MTKTVLLLASVTLAVLVTSGVTLTAGTEPARAAFPGANGKIVFSSDRPTQPGQITNRGEIYTINPDGTGLEQLTTNDYRDYLPAFSPNGNQIVFTRERREVGNNEDIFKMNADGSGETHLTKGADPSWSPGGRQIVFERRVDRNSEIFKINADGSELTRLTNNTVFEEAPVWSPDGRWIAFCRSDGANIEIYKMRANGSDLIQLTELNNNEAVNASSPAWSPDGKQIAFASNKDDPRNDVNYEIYRMNADGSREIRLTHSPAMVQDDDPAWSPNGHQIAFQKFNHRSFTGEIYRMGVGGAGLTNVTKNPMRDEWPDWGSVPVSLQ